MSRLRFESGSSWLGLRRIRKAWHSPPRQVDNDRQCHRQPPLVSLESRAVPSTCASGTWQRLQLTQTNRSHFRGPNRSFTGSSGPGPVPWCSRSWTCRRVLGTGRARLSNSSALRSARFLAPPKRLGLPTMFAFLWTRQCLDVGIDPRPAIALPLLRESLYAYS